MNSSNATQRRSAPGTRTLVELPGPRGWPLVGNLLQIDQPRMHAQLEDWADAHGPLYRLRLGARDVLVVARSDLIAGMLRDRPDGWRRWRTIADLLREMGGHGVFSAEGEDWRRQRRLVMAAFDPGHLKRYFPALVRVTERLRQRLDAAARSGEAIDALSVLMRYTVDVTAGLAFGIDVNTLQVPENAIQNHLDKMLPKLFQRMNAPIPYWRTVRLPSDRAFDRHLAKVHEAVRGYLRMARERMQSNASLYEQPTNLLEAMIAARDDRGAGLSEEELVGNVLTVLIAGEDTTANTLGWALYLLHTHRAVWRELVEEVDAALAGDDFPRSFDVARGFDFMEACINETMRLRPVAPVLFMENNREAVLDGVTVPRGTLVLCVMRAGAVDTRFAQDAAAYRPARWREASPPDAAQVPEDARSGRAPLKASMPFGSGPRLCPGRYLALLEMKMILATFARNYELVDVSTEDGAPPAERLAFTMSPEGLRIRLAPRAAK
jgi:cytochrome P450